MIELYGGSGIYPKSSYVIKVFSSKPKLIAHLYDYGIENWDANATYVVDGLKCLFFYIDKNSWFLDINDVANNIRNINEQTVYLILNDLHVRFKVALLNTLFKKAFKFEKYLTSKTNTWTTKYVVVDRDKYTPMIKEYVNRIECADFARSLASEPSNMLYPEELCKTMKKELAGSPVRVKVLNERDMEKLGLNLVLGVGMGSKHPPRFLIMEFWSKQRDAKTICLCGKGVVFDSGGYNMKTSKAMEGMKGDKTGGAIVCGIMRHIAKHHPDFKANVIGLVPLVENLVSHKALKTGDVLTSYSGKTVEVSDTDAEGRLILADALSFCEKYDPDYILDFATLTGWSSRIHCSTSFAFYSTNDVLSNTITELGEHNGERSVRMPKWTEYMRYTKSTVADLRNFGSKCKQSDGFMATMFLLNFLPPNTRNKWVHFDITHERDGSLHNCNGFATGLELVMMLGLRSIK